MIGSIIGAGMKAAGSIFGGIKASQAMKKVQKNLEQREKENQSWYDRRYNEDATQRADAQRLLAMTEESIRNRNRQAAGQAAVMGGTEESLANTRAANARSYGDVMGQLAVAADARKDQIENQYITRKDQINDKLNDLQVNKANNIIQAVNGVAQAGNSIATSLDGGSVTDALTQKQA